MKTMLDVMVYPHTENTVKLSIIKRYNITGQNRDWYCFDKGHEYIYEIDTLWSDKTSIRKDEVPKIEDGKLIGNIRNVFFGGPIQIAAENVPTYVTVSYRDYKLLAQCEKVRMAIDRKVMHKIYLGRRHEDVVSSQTYMKYVISDIIDGNTIQAKCNYAKDERTKWFIEWLGDWGVGLVSDGGKLVMNGDIPLDLTGKIK